MVTSEVKNKAIAGINHKFLEIMKERGKTTSKLLPPLSKIKNAEHTSQYKLVKDLNSNKLNDLLINKTIPVTLCDNLTIRDTDKKFELEGDLLIIITNKNYNVDLANLSDQNYCLNLQRKYILMKKLWVINLLGINHLQDYFNEWLSCFPLPVFPKRDFSHLILMNFAID